MVDRSVLEAALDDTLGSTSFHEIGEKYEGKVRDNYTRGDRRFIVVTDRISAFDRVLGTIPFKGQVLNRVATYWFDKTRGIAPNHVIRVPDPNVLECVQCEPLLVEMVMRGYLAGTTSTSIWVHYQKGARRFCGHDLPEGMTKNQKLPEPLLTPATKAPIGEHDQSVSREEILAAGKVSAADFDLAASYARALFAEGQRLAGSRGLIMADTKYELGKTPDGRVILIDEIHTPDSSRYWVAASYDERVAKGLEPEGLDKDYVRRWLLDQGYTGDGAPPALTDEVRIEAARRYIDACERITGEHFVPDTRPPAARILENLSDVK